MKKNFCLFLLFVLSLSQISLLFADTFIEGPQNPESIDGSLKFPEGETFQKLQKLLDTYFFKNTPGSYGYRYNCIANNTFCPNAKYTSVISKQFKFLVLSSFSGNEAFYSKLFPVSPYAWQLPGISDLTRVLKGIPEGTSVGKPLGVDFFSSSSSFLQPNYAWDLLDASFGIDFSEQNQYNDFLSAIRNKIEEMKRTKCYKSGSGAFMESCYSNVSNAFLPTQEELMGEIIYRNGNSEKIADHADEFEYKITGSQPNVSYTVTYSKKSFSYEEAMKEISKVQTQSVTFGSSNRNGRLPCLDSSMSIDREKCSIALNSLQSMRSGVEQYYQDKAEYPLSLDDPSLQVYLRIPEDFAKNFTYSTPADRQSYVFTYIGHIGETQVNTDKKDYKALMNGANAENVPAVFKQIPNDTVFAYIRNPQSLIELLNSKSDTMSRVSGIDVSLQIKGLLQDYFELDDFTRIEQNLKHEMAISLTNLDTTSPDIVVIISEQDREALAPSAKARIVASKNGYIFIANSKKLIERFTGLEEKDSMFASDDLNYVWWKKWILVKDMFLFAGDAFFEKMLTFDNYVETYRKFRDYNRLNQLQELVWAYQDATGKPAESLEEVTNLLAQYGAVSAHSGSLADYRLEKGVVFHQNIGSLKSINGLSESNYDLKSISREEIEGYKSGILHYRDSWRANLDPMGIVINRFWDGMEIDGFMTPIPNMKGDLGEMIKLFQNVTKEKLDFISNPKVRAGIASWVIWFDPAKAKNTFSGSTELGKELERFDREFMDGKHVLDYLGGEFAFSIGGIDPDIFDGWNVNKTDVYASIQVASESKGMELIDTIRDKWLRQFGWSTRSDDVMSKALGLVAKPLIEDYRDKKIYYVEDVPFLFGKIGIAYAFTNNFIVIGLNRTTIKNVIDVSLDEKASKAQIIDAGTSGVGTFFGFMLDWNSASKQVVDVIGKNDRLANRLTSFLEMGNNGEVFSSLASKYYALSDRNKRLANSDIPFDYAIGFTHISGKDGELRVRVDESKTQEFSWSLQEAWNTLKPKLDPTVFSKEGADGFALISKPEIDELVSLNLYYSLVHASGSESLLRNLTFTMNMASDEIGFIARVFRQKSPDASESWFTNSLSKQNQILLVGFAIIGIVLVIGGIVILSRRQNPPTTPQ